MSVHGATELAFAVNGDAMDASPGLSIGTPSGPMASCRMVRQCGVLLRMCVGYVCVCCAVWMICAVLGHCLAHGLLFDDDTVWETAQPTIFSCRWRCGVLPKA